MNKEQVEGKVKDVAGRAERQAGEWTGSEEHQAKGTLKQAEGKAENAWGQAKEAGKKAMERVEEKRDDQKPGNQAGSVQEEKEVHTTTRKAS